MYNSNQMSILHSLAVIGTQKVFGVSHGLIAAVSMATTFSCTCHSIP